MRKQELGGGGESKTGLAGLWSNQAAEDFCQSQVRTELSLVPVSEGRGG